MYLFETRGEGDLSFGLFGEKSNGFAVGKRWMNVTIEMWRQDIQRGILFRHELEEDFPKWFLDKFLGFPRQQWPLDKETTRRYCEVQDERETTGEIKEDGPDRHDGPALGAVDCGVQAVGM